MMGKNHSRWIAPLLLSLFVSSIVFLTLDDYGVAWDEGVYVYSGILYCEWLRRPSLATVDECWRTNREHPPLGKVLSGLAERLFHQDLGLLDRLSSARLPAVVFTFLLTWALFSFARELYGPAVALLVALAFSFMPRAFYHAHLAALDYPSTAMWFLVVYSYWKGFRRQGWIVVSSVLLGFALLMKENAVFLYLPVLFYWSLHYGTALKALVSGRAKPAPGAAARAFKRLIPIIVIPPAIFVAFWPWLWEETGRRLAEYLVFHVHHGDIPVYYMGRLYYSAPWHYPFVMAAVTVPVVVLIPFFAGAIAAGASRDREANLFLLFNALFPLLLVSLQVAKYDGVRLFLQAFPFICMVAGGGVGCALRCARRRGGYGALYGLCVVLLAATVYFSVVRIHPYQSSYFNEAIGGLRGAARAGFEPEYWGNAYRGLLGWMNQHPEGTYWVYMAEKDLNVPLDFNLYKECGLLDPGVRIGGREDGNYLVLLARPGMFNSEMWLYYLYGKPLASVNLSGVELAGIYELK